MSADGKKIIVDTNIPPDVLREISDYNNVAIMLCDPPDICFSRFFDRDDPEKQFMLEQIKKCKDPDAALKNFNSWALYHPPVEIDWNNICSFIVVLLLFLHKIAVLFMSVDNANRLQI